VIGLLLWGVVLPALVAAALYVPVFLVARFAVLRRHGEGPELQAFQRSARRWGGLLLATSYVVLGTGVFAPGVVPAVSGFIMRGGLGFLVLLVPLDLVLAVALSPERALAGRRRTGG